MKFAMIGLVSAVLGFSATVRAAGPASTPALLEKGKASYSTNCLICHGDLGDGNGVAGAMMNPKPRNFAKDKFKKGDKVEAVFKTLTDGMTGTAMVAFGHLPEEERWALAHYVLSLRRAKK